MTLRRLAQVAALVVVLVLSLTAVAAAPTKPLHASLTGSNEIGPNGEKGVGDPDGGGSFSAVIDGTELCFGLSVRDIGIPTAAHIHAGKQKVNGPIVVPLVHPTQGDPGASSGCVPLDAVLAEAIRKHPGQYYVNVHTEDHPAGAIRGQLFSK
jgi:CHRD domain